MQTISNSPIIMWLWQNGAICAENQATLAATSAAALSGHGVFSTLGIVAGRARWPDRHFARLARDAARSDLLLPDDGVLRAAVDETIAANSISHGIARVTLTARGDGRWNQESGVDCTIIVRSSPDAAKVPQELRVWLSPHFVDARRPLCGVKSTSYEPYNALWRAARKRGWDEALVRESGDALCEGARHNLFWVRDGELYTPALECGCLPGIGRALILEWAHQHQMVAHQGHFDVESLHHADEIFLTNAVHGPRSVSHFNDDAQTINFAASGPLTLRFQSLWHAADSD